MICLKYRSDLSLFALRSNAKSLNGIQALHDLVAAYLECLILLFSLLTTLFTLAFFWFTKCIKSFSVLSAAQMIFSWTEKLLYFAWLTSGHLRTMFKLKFSKREHQMPYYVFSPLSQLCSYLYVYVIWKLNTYVTLYTVNSYHFCAML